MRKIDRGNLTALGEDRSFMGSLKPTSCIQDFILFLLYLQAL